MITRVPRVEAGELQKDHPQPSRGSAAASAAIPPSTSPPHSSVAIVVDEPHQVIGWESACRLIFPNDKPCYHKIHRLVKRGAKVRGRKDTIKLRVYPTPRTMAFLRSDVVAFIHEFQVAWRVANGVREDGARPTGGAVKQIRRQTTESLAAAGLGVSERDCRPEEVGTYPRGAVPRRGRDLRLVGTDTTKASVGRRLDVTA